MWIENSKRPRDGASFHAQRNRYPCTENELLLYPDTAPGEPIALTVAVCFHVALGIEIVPCTIDLLPTVLRIPAGLIFIPPADGIMLPASLEGIEAISICIVPLSIDPFIGIIGGKVITAFSAADSDRCYFAL